MCQRLGESPEIVSILKTTCILSVLLVSFSGTSLTCFGQKDEGYPHFGQTARSFSMGGSLQHFTEQVPVLETNFCATHHKDSSSEGKNSFSFWSIPYFSLSVPIGNSLFGFRRNCVRDYYCRFTTFSGVLVSSGALWSNAIWWKHRVFTRVLLNLEVGILAGEIVNVCGSHPYLFFRRERVSGRILGSSFTLTQEFYEIYGGVRHYDRDEHPSEIWLGLRREISPVRNGRLELAYHPMHPSARKNSEFPEFHFGMEEEISKAVWLRYGFATMPSPVLFCLTFGCGVRDEMLSLDTALGSYFFENEAMVRLMVGLSARL